MRRLIFINRYFYPDISATSQILSDLVFQLPKEEFEVHIITSRLKYNEIDSRLNNKEKIEDFSTTSIGAFLFGFLTTAGIDKQDIQSVIDVMSRVDIKETIIGGVLFFLLWRHKRKAGE